MAVDPFTQGIAIPFAGMCDGCLVVLACLASCDGTMAVTDADAQATRERLARLEGLHVGFSAAANVYAASCLLRSGRLPIDAVVATVLCDSGMKY